MTSGIAQGAQKLQVSLSAHGINASVVPYSQAALFCRDSAPAAFDALWAQDGTCVHWGPLGATFNAMTLVGSVFGLSADEIRAIGAKRGEEEAALSDCSARAVETSRLQV